MGNLPFGFILLLVTILAVQMHALKWNTKALEEKEKELFGKCKEINNGLTHHETIELKKCNGFTDYRCFKACQAEKMNILSKNGFIQIIPFKAILEMKNTHFGFKDEVYVNEMLSCSGMGKESVLSTDTSECAKRNGPYLKCLIETHHKHCNSDKPIPSVPTTMP